MIFIFYWNFWFYDYLYSTNKLILFIYLPQMLIFWVESLQKLIFLLRSFCWEKLLKAPNQMDDIHFPKEIRENTKVKNNFFFLKKPNKRCLFVIEFGVL